MRTPARNAVWHNQLMVRGWVTLAFAVALAVACSHAPRDPGPAPNAVMLPTAAKGPLDLAGWALPSAAHPGEQLRCVDRELRARDLNESGDPDLTAVNRPLGISGNTDAYRSALRKRPDIATTCTRAPGEPDR